MIFFWFSRRTVRYRHPRRERNLYPAQPVVVTRTWWRIGAVWCGLYLAAVCWHWAMPVGVFETVTAIAVVVPILCVFGWLVHAQLRYSRETGLPPQPPSEAPPSAPVPAPLTPLNPRMFWSDRR